MLSKDNVYSPVMQIAYELISLAQNDETTDQELFAKLEDIDENNIKKLCAVYAYGIGELYRENAHLRKITETSN